MEPRFGRDYGDVIADTTRMPLLNDNARHHATSTAEKLSGLFEDWWLWEVIGATTCVLALSVIIVILVVFDSSSLPDWPSVFTINSVISFFATVAKLSISSAVGAAMSQCKWLWYRQTEPRRLQDLQMFDDASRGPLGAAQLLISLRARHLAFVGAIVSILILLFDPFLQQVVVYPSRSVSSGSAAIIVRSEAYGAHSDEDLPLPSVVDLSMKAAVYDGVFAIGNHADRNIQYNCPTGNCTWPDFSTLAVCSRCEDITSLVEKTCNNTGCYKLSLPNGPTLTGFGGQINASVTNISATLHEIQASVIKFTSLMSKRIEDPNDALAVECAMWYCVQTYSASVENSVISQKALASWRNDSATLAGSSDLFYNVSTFNLSTDTDTALFKVSYLAAKALNTFMTKTFTGNGGMNTTGSAFSSDIMQALYNTNNLTARIGNLAISMTNNIRQQNDTVARPSYGTAWKSETYVHVRWAWLAFPIAVIALALIFLLGSIIETANRDILVWKTSNLALLFHGQDLKLKDPPTIHVNKVGQMTRMAEKVTLHLVQNQDDDWSLVQK